MSDTPSKNSPRGDSLSLRLARLRSAADAIEQLAADYHSVIRPVREALQAVADVPLEDRDRWTGTVSALACRLVENGMADVPASLESVERWDRQFDAGNPGRAFAGRTFCTALATAIADGSPPSEFFATLDRHSFITTLAATREVCAVLSRLLHVHTERTAPRFTRDYGTILAEVGIDGETLRDRLAQCGMPLSGEADAAIHDWDECSSGIPFYQVTIRPSGSCTSEPSEPGRSERSAQPDEGRREHTSPSTPTARHLPCGTAVERMFDNNLNPFRIMAALAQEVGCVYRDWACGGESLARADRMIIYVRWNEAREAALRLAGTAGLSLDTADREVLTADIAFTALHQALATEDRSADTNGLDAASVRLYDLGLLTDEAWRTSYRWNSPAASESPTVENTPSRTTGMEEGGGRTPQPSDKPDGPFDGGFRYAGGEVPFKRADKQYRLVLALWDDEQKCPRSARDVEDVIADVYGHDNDTTDSAFRQLCADTRRKFESKNCPLTIQTPVPGKVQLIPL